MGKYHPHGDLAIYDTMVRMAQPFSLRYPLIDGQGNFGSVDGDNAAASRYTEVRLSKIAEAMIADLDRETVDFVNRTTTAPSSEPVVLPAKIPNLLINGSTGIAVGMATNMMPPHNLREVVDACLHVLHNPDLHDRRPDRDRPGARLPHRRRDPRHHRRARGLSHRPRSRRDAREDALRGDR